MGPESRIPLHTRQVLYQVYARPDGLWDVEGTLRDTKEVRVERLSLPALMPGDTVHHMHVRVTVDDGLQITAIEAHMHVTPFGECQQASVPLQRLVGRRLGRGWRRALEDTMGGVAGCTHIRELLMNLATAAMQGINTYRDQQRLLKGQPAMGEGEMPHFVDGCLSWRRDGPVVQRLFPQFALKTLKGTDA